ncbi:MAG: sulfite exporter TauE/SafE family protein [Acidobacteria bacterium]|nr:sulfite exporter TauE/SafE family protein [Acidobacteriota bacterium]
MDYGILAMSFVVGMMIGLTSMGGAALMAPFLILGLGVQPVLAVRTDLVYSAITKVVGTLMHWRQGTVDFATAGKLAMGSVPGGLLGSACVIFLPRLGIDANRSLQRAIGVMLVAVALILLARVFAGDWLADRAPHLERLQGSGAVAWGAIVGFCVGLTSVGSGSLMVPFLMLVFPLSPAKVVGTDVFHAAILVSVTGLAHSAAGPVDWRLVAQLLTGSVPGVMLGSHLAPRVPAKALRAGLAVALLATGIKMA